MVGKGAVGKYSESGKIQIRSTATLHLHSKVRGELSDRLEDRFGPEEPEEEDLAEAQGPESEEDPSIRVLIQTMARWGIINKIY